MRSLALAATLLAVPAAAAAPTVHVEGWARAGTGSSAAYLTLHNSGAVADRLVAVSSPAARSVSVHTTTNTGGVARMRPAGAVAVPAGGMVKMAPGGLHVMVTGLKAPLRPGTRLPLTLRFARAGLVQASVPVLAPGANTPVAGHHGH